MFTPSYRELVNLREEAAKLGLKRSAGDDACYASTCFQGALERVRAWAAAAEARTSFLNPRKGA